MLVWCLLKSARHSQVSCLKQSPPYRARYWAGYNTESCCYFTSAQVRCRLLALSITTLTLSPHGHCFSQQFSPSMYSCSCNWVWNALTFPQDVLGDALSVGHSITCFCFLYVSISFLAVSLPLPRCVLILMYRAVPVKLLCSLYGMCLCVSGSMYSLASPKSMMWMRWCFLLDCRPSRKFSGLISL